MVGGTVSHLVGGNFGNGAITGAFQRAFNAEGDHCNDACLEEQTYRDNMQTRMRLVLSGTKDGAEVAGVVVEEGWWAAVTGAVGRILGGTRSVNATRLGKSAEAAAGVTHGHHPWPKYLGGPGRQDLARLPKTVHDAFHSGLDKILPRQRGTAHYAGLSPAARLQMQRDLADFTIAFDAKYGTQLYQSMLRNGFTRP